MLPRAVEPNRVRTVLGVGEQVLRLPPIALPSWQTSTVTRGQVWNIGPEDGHPWTVADDLPMPADYSSIRRHQPNVDGSHILRDGQQPLLPASRCAAGPEPRRPARWLTLYSTANRSAPANQRAECPDLHPIRQGVDPRLGRPGGSRSLGIAVRHRRVLIGWSTRELCPGDWRPPGRAVSADARYRAAPAT